MRDIDYGEGLDYLATVGDDGRFNKWSIEPESMGTLLESEGISRDWLTSVDIIEDKYYIFSGHDRKIEFRTPFGNCNSKVGSIINKCEIVVRKELYTAIVATMTKGLIIMPMQD